MTTITLRDGLGAPFLVASEANSGILTPHSVPEIGGAAVSATNPMPVAAVEGGTWPVAQSGSWSVAQSGSWTVEQGGNWAVTQSGTWSMSLTAALPAGGNLIGQVAPAGGGAISRSVTTVAATSTLLMPANAARKQFWFQAPQTSGVWINRLGGAAGPNLADCTYWPAGAYYETGTAVSTAALTYYCGTAGLMLIAGEI